MTYNNYSEYIVHYECKNNTQKRKKKRRTKKPTQTPLISTRVIMLTEENQRKKSPARPSSETRAISLGGPQRKLTHPPDKSIMHCTLCSGILRDPHQVTCCGKNFCKKCLEEIVSKKYCCPSCQAASCYGINNDSLLVKPRKLLPNQARGSDWVESLDKTGKYMNILHKDRDLQFLEAECPYCVKYLKRCNLKRHMSEICLKRPFTCQLCLSYESTYDDVLENHQPMCPSRTPQCTNDCGEIMTQVDMDSHIENDCSLKTLSCEFESVGCTAKLPRKEMSNHIVYHTSMHMSLMAKMLNDIACKTETMEANMKKEIEKLKEENDSLWSKVRKISKQAWPTKSPIVIFPTQTLTKEVLAESKEPESKKDTIMLAELKMADFSKHKRQNLQWYSPPFYSHQKGYRFCLQVQANGCRARKGQFVSLYMCMMHGEFDDRLAWPFYGEFIIELVNQNKGEKNHCMTVHFKDMSLDSAAGRVFGRDQSKKVMGIPDFIHLSELPMKFLKNDCLIFRVRRDYQCSCPGTRSLD